MKKFFWLSVLLAWAGCRCGSNLGNTERGFRLEESAVDFGRVLEGQAATRQVHLVSTGRLDVTVSVSITSGFSAASEVVVPGGATAVLDITFTATHNGALDGTLTVEGAELVDSAQLYAVGVHPLTCIPSGPCITSTYSLDLDRCVEESSPEGASCQPESICLEKGQCHQGMCQGISRSCNDQDECTVDACADGVGCVYAPRACPAPTAPCHVATCDSKKGCGEGLASDGALCGSVDCDKAHICALGSCLEVDTPEGTTCGPPTPCQTESTCQQKKCVAPDAGLLKPEYSLVLVGTPRPPLVSYNQNLYTEVCGLTLPPVDSGVVDAGADAGDADAGDASEPDAGVSDGGGGEFDGGYCALVSYTSTGFERWTSHHRDAGEAPQLLHVGSRGAGLLAGAQYLRLAANNGTFVERIELPESSAAESFALDSRSMPWAILPSGALVQLTDGGITELAHLDGGAAVLALDSAGRAYVYDADAGVCSRFELLADAGASMLTATAPGTDNLQSLSVAQGHVWAGGHTFLSGELDSGVTLHWTSDASEPLQPEGPFLLGGNGALTFFHQCSSPVMSCLDSQKDLWAITVDPATGDELWRALVLPAGLHGTFSETSLLAGAPGAFVMVNQLNDGDGGLGAVLQIFANGKRLVACPMPDGTRLESALFSSGRLFTIGQRDGGAHRLDAYDLKGLPLLDQGWPISSGVAGSRAEH